MKRSDRSPGRGAVLCPLVYAYCYRVATILVPEPRFELGFPLGRPILSPADTVRGRPPTPILSMICTPRAAQNPGQSTGVATSVATTEVTSVWEYRVLRYQFAGPRDDDWPKGDEFRERWEQASAVRPVGGGVVNPWNQDPGLLNLRDEYWRWARQVERQTFDDLGRLGFELVTLQVGSESDYTAAFKRRIGDGVEPLGEDLALPALPGLDRVN